MCILKDLLKILPDFTEIELFKDEICRTLQYSSEKIEILKNDMNEITESSENIVNVSLLLLFDLKSCCLNDSKFMIDRN